MLPCYPWKSELMLTIFTAAIQGFMRSSKIHPKRVCHSGSRMSNRTAGIKPVPRGQRGQGTAARPGSPSGESTEKTVNYSFPSNAGNESRQTHLQEQVPEGSTASGHDSRDQNLCISKSFHRGSLQPDAAGRLNYLSQEPAAVFPSPPWYGAA